MTTTFQNPNGSCPNGNNSVAIFLEELRRFATFRQFKLFKVHCMILNTLRNNVQKRPVHAKLLLQFNPFEDFNNFREMQPCGWRSFTASRHKRSDNDQNQHWNLLWRKRHRPKRTAFYQEPRHSSC